MGLLDRWNKKKKEQQLEKAEEPKKVAEKAVTEEVKPEEAVVKVKKATAKIVKTKKDKETKEKEEVTKRDVKAGSMVYKILVRPLVTEKSAIMESQNKYSFLVAKNANKIQIKEAVKELYGVNPVAVNVVNVDGRRVRFGRGFGRRSDYRKAVVTLPAGKSITIHEGV